MSRRRFSGRQRVALYLAQGGRCAECGEYLNPGWHADHKLPWVHGGETNVVNGQALCASCNLKKGSKVADMGMGQTTYEPREWQLRAWDKYLSDQKTEWLLCATPGAGKTKWALGLARQLLDSDVIDRVVVVTPTRTIRNQWTIWKEGDPDSVKVKLTMVENKHGGLEHPDDFEGIVLTYGQVASNPKLQEMGCQRGRTLVIFDEIHHAGYPNLAWGEATNQAFHLSVKRIGMTGTPWRRPGSGYIPFVVYDRREDGKETVHVDFAYEYGTAIREEVCRAIEFRAYDGEVEYVYLDSCVRPKVVYTLEDEDDNTPILRTLLKSDGPWMRSMLEMAHKELLAIRRGSDGEDAIRDAQGLVIADNQQDAKALKTVLAQITGETPEVIISEDEEKSQESLERFKRGSTMWAIAVNMVSEGVDVPALYVGVYATRKKTPLIFRQIVGRFVRRRVDSDGKPRLEEERAAVLFIPAVASLIELAREIEEELRHEIELEREEYERQRKERAEMIDEEWDNEHEPLMTNISEPDLDVVIISGVAYLRAEYDEAVSYYERFGFKRADDIERILKMFREVRQQSEMAEPMPKPGPSATPTNVNKINPHNYKKMLWTGVEHLARKKASALKIDYKEFNISLLKRFGPRRKLSIKELEAQLQWLEQLDADNWKKGMP